MDWHLGTVFSLRPAASSATQFSYMVSDNPNDAVLSAVEQHDEQEDISSQSIQEKLTGHSSQFHTNRKTDKTVSNMPLLDPLHDLSCDATIPFDSRLSQDEYQVINSVSLSNPGSPRTVGAVENSKAIKQNIYSAPTNIPEVDNRADPFDTSQPDLKSLITSSETLLHRRISDVLQSAPPASDLMGQKQIIGPGGNERISVPLPRVSPTSMAASSQQPQIDSPNIVESFIRDEYISHDIAFEGGAVNRDHHPISQCMDSDTIQHESIAEGELTSVLYIKRDGNSRTSKHAIEKARSLKPSKIINTRRPGRGDNDENRKDCVDEDYKEKCEYTRCENIWHSSKRTNNNEKLNNQRFVPEAAQKNDFEQDINPTEENESMNDANVDDVDISILASSVQQNIEDTVSNKPGSAKDVNPHINDIQKVQNTTTVASGIGDSKMDNRNSNGLTKRGDKRKPRTYSQAVPSQHCHICSRRPTKASPHAVCGNLLRGRCRKTICTKCFHTFRWDLKAAREGEPGSWECPHCRGECPQRAQCVIYNRTSDRRRLKLINHRKRKAEQTVSSEKQSIDAKKKCVTSGRENAICQKKKCIRSIEAQDAEYDIKLKGLLGTKSRLSHDPRHFEIAKEKRGKVNTVSDVCQRENFECDNGEGITSKTAGTKHDSLSLGISRPTLFAHLERAVSMALMGSKDDLNIGNPTNNIGGTGTSTDKDIGITGCGVLNEGILMVDEIMDDVDDLQISTRMNADHDVNMKWLLNEFGEDLIERNAKAEENEEEIVAGWNEIRSGVKKSVNCRSFPGENRSSDFGSNQQGSTENL